MALLLSQQQNNQRFRDIRKKQFTLNSQQKLVFKEIFRRYHSPNFVDSEFYNIIIYGIPSQFRNWVWCSLIPNQLCITSTFYNTLLEHLAQHQARFNHQKILTLRQSQTVPNGQFNNFINQLHKNDESNQTSMQIDEKTPKLYTVLKNIQLDLPRTFPQLKTLHSDPEQYNKVTRILGAFSIIRQDIGYIQGMSQLAVLLLQELNNQLYAFIALTTLISTSTLNDFYTFNETSINSMLQKISQIIEIKSSDLFAVLSAHQIEPRIYAVNWIMTMFTRIFKVDSILAIWDIIIANFASRTCLQELCAIIVISRKKAIIECNNPSKIIKILLHSKLDLSEQDFVLQYMRSIPKSP